MRAITIALAFAVAAVCAAQERVVSVCGAEKINSTGITLVLFANDASSRYANNYGSLRVRITPVE